MKVMYERVAGIDVHKDMIKVAVRSPGDKPWTRKTEIFTFRTFYGVLKAMARELRGRGVTHVVMEASGVYTEPVYYALCEEDFTEVAVVNPAHAKALKGHKTEALCRYRHKNSYADLRIMSRCHLAGRVCADHERSECPPSRHNPDAPSRLLPGATRVPILAPADRKSTRLNSSHLGI